MTVTIRHFKPEDQSDTVAITDIYGHHVTYGSGSFEYEPPSISDMRQRLEMLVAKSYPILLAKEDGTVIGYAYAGPYNDRKI